MHSSFERVRLILTIIISHGTPYTWQYDVREGSYLNPISTLNLYQLLNMCYETSKF
jgi:hypothetical protein